MVLALHSLIRYLLLAAGVAVVGYGSYGAATGRPFDPGMGRLAGAFAGLLHLNVLVGIVLLFTGRADPRLAGHVFMMVFAAVAAQVVPSVMRRRPAEERTWLPYVVSALTALGLVWIGLLAIGRRIV